MIKLLERRAPREARLLAEALELLEAGWSVDAVLESYPGDAHWLGSLLEIGRETGAAFGSPAPDLAFAADLRQAFLAAARKPSFVAVPRPGLERLRAPFAAAAVAAAVSGVGVLSYGMVTADQAVPGDWNYTLKVTKERLEDTFAGHDSKVDIQIRQTEARVYELQQLNNRGSLSAADLAKLEREARELTNLARSHDFDDSQRLRLRGILDGASVVLTQAEERQPDLVPAVTATKKTVNEAVVATGAGTVTSISEPTPTATASPTATVTASAEPAAGTPPASEPVAEDE